MCIVVILGQGVSYFEAAKIDWNGIIASYIGLPIFFGLWFSYKKKHKTTIISLEDINFNIEDEHSKKEVV